MSATRGPMPKRSEERRRRNKPENEGDLPLTRTPGNFDSEAPEHPGVFHAKDNPTGWHPIAIQLYESLEESGQSQWFQPSDWATAFLLCESVSRDLLPQFVGMQDRFNREAGQMEHIPVKMKLPLKGASIAGYLKGMGELGYTEGARRRMRMELTRGDDEGLTPEQQALATVTDMRNRFGATS